MKRILLLLLVTLTFTACSDKEKETELENRISELEILLDDCLNGADKLLAQIKNSYEDENYTNVKSIYSEFKDRHPESDEFKEAKIINDEVVELEEKQEKEKKRIAKEEREEKLKALNKLKKNHDDVSGITWYKQPYFTHYSNSNLTSIYIGKRETNKWLNITMSYTGDDWIFFERAYLSYEGNTKEIFFNKYKDKKTDHGSGVVWEWIGLSLTEDLEIFLRDFAQSKDAKMRLAGKYTKTRKLTYNERRGILDVLNGYDALEKE